MRAGFGQRHGRAGLRLIGGASRARQAGQVGKGACIDRAAYLAAPACAGLLGADTGSATWQRDVAWRYAASWRQHFAGRLRLAATFAQAAMRPALAGPLLALTSAWPGLLTAGARWGGKVRCAVDARTVAELAKVADKRQARPATARAEPQAHPHRLKETT